MQLPARVSRSRPTVSPTRCALIWAIPAIIVHRDRDASAATGRHASSAGSRSCSPARSRRGMFDFLVKVHRYGVRTNAYVTLLTDTYPKYESARHCARGAAGRMGPMRRALACLVAALALDGLQGGHHRRRDGAAPTVRASSRSRSIADADLVATGARPGRGSPLRRRRRRPAGRSTGPTATDDGGLQVVLTHTVRHRARKPPRCCASSTDRTARCTTWPSRAPSPTTPSPPRSRGTLRVDGGLDAFADPDVLAAIGGSPYADDIAATNLRPTDVVTFTLHRRPARRCGHRRRRRHDGDGRAGR